MTTFSIITVSLNSAATIEATINSVANQSYDKIEYIVKDGRSNDETPRIIAAHRDAIDIYVSTPDDGIYDAMNQGISMASGDVIFFLNSDDALYDRDVIANVATLFDFDRSLNFVYGDIVLVSAIGRRQRVRLPMKLTRRRLCYSTLCHQALFQKRDLFTLIGQYDTRYSVVSDFDWIMRAYSSNRLRYTHAQRIISYVGTGGVSHTTRWKAEKQAVLSEHFSHREILFWRTLPRALRAVARFRCL